MKILMSNLGYLRGIDGRLLSHFRYAYRHVYSPVAAQKKILQQLISIIKHEDPDICCFVEIDKGSISSANFNQLSHLIDDNYAFYDIENKYNPASGLRLLSFLRGKSNAFVAKRAFAFEKIYFEHGIKRLIYKIHLSEDLTLFFAHFSLKKKIRTLQLEQMGRLLKEMPGNNLFMGDFNILCGVQELAPLLDVGEFVLLNDLEVPTFKFHRSSKMLDLCICPVSLACRLSLRIIQQPFSDHEALLLEINP